MVLLIGPRLEIDGDLFSAYAQYLQDGLGRTLTKKGELPHDNAVAESFFQLLKRERIKRTIYKTRGHARQDIFDYIEMFYNPIRRHSHAANLSPVNYEQQ